MPFADLHAHLLWGLDDGARDEPESLQLCRLLAEQGYSDAAATPHAGPELPDAAAADGRRAELAASLSAAAVPLRLHPGAEHRLDGDLLEQAARGAARALGRGRWVLAEAPLELPLPGMEQLCFRLQVLGLQPLLAHPERCRAFQDEPALAQRLVAAGAALQLDLCALVGAYGHAARKLAERLLGEGLYAVAASDLHRAEPSMRLFPPALAAIRRLAGEASALRLLDRNPHRVLRGEALS
jgi:protein-tyrosine phosphatase